MIGQMLSFWHLFIVGYSIVVSDSIFVMDHLTGKNRIIRKTVIPYDVG